MQVGQFPRWPAKVLKDIDEKRKLVWFFGTDDRYTAISETFELVTKMVVRMSFNRHP